MIEADVALSTSDTMVIGDIDTRDVVTASKLFTSAIGDRNGMTDATLEAMFTITPMDILDDSETTDTLSWNFNSNAESFDYLAEGQRLELVYTVTATDDNNSEELSDSKQVTMTITGTNDNPLLTVDTVGTVIEDATTPTLTDSGALSFTDVDTTDTHTVTSTYNDDATWSKGTLTDTQVTALTGGFSSDSDSWDYSVDNADIQFLAKDERVTFSYDVKVADNNGGSDTN